MSLKSRLVELVTLEGPMSVADYMWHCLFDPKDGYYSQKVKIGREGDFITAPMVSQIFGELIATWIAQTWANMGAPQKWRLVEIGGGDGTLMSDILRVLRRGPQIIAGLEVMMIEPSPTLRESQKHKLQTYPIAFVNDLTGLKDDLPMIIVANEVLDCLPARQYVRAQGKWFERRIGLNAAKELSFGLHPTPAAFNGPVGAEDGDIYEHSTAQAQFIDALSAKLKPMGGVALLIDYGRDEPGPGDTLQALHKHRKHDPLEAPGEHDLTMWADFPLIQRRAKSQGLNVSLITRQSVFLVRLGILERLEALVKHNPEQADVLQRQVRRLMASEEMGHLFKVIALSSPSSLQLPALERHTAPLSD